MGARSSGPEGYRSNLEALLELVRFGFEIWGAARMAVLLFHVERSTSYGKVSDLHSQRQAMYGVYAAVSGRWVRGPAGVSRATWNRENGALEAAGVLVRLPRRTTRGGNAATEFAPNWLAIRAAIEEWKASAVVPVCTPLFERGVSQSETSACLTEGQPLSQGETSPCLSVGHTVLSSGFETVVSKCADGGGGATGSPSVVAVAEAVANAWGGALEGRAASVPGELMALAERVGVPAAALCRWIGEFAARKRGEAYAITSARLFVRAAASELIPWARANRAVIGAAAEAERRAERAGRPVSVLEPVRFERCEVCGAEDVLDGICHSEKCAGARARACGSIDVPRRVSAL